jgi:phenylalanyl-tRNA synthetase beta chain
LKTFSFFYCKDRGNIMQRHHPGYPGLGFTIINEDAEGMKVAVPFHKTDITLPADIAEEIMRIDGFDNIAIPTNISFSPATETLGRKEALREKISGILAGMGFREMLNNSITNSAYYGEPAMTQAVKMMNSLCRVEYTAPC